MNRFLRRVMEIRDAEMEAKMSRPGMPGAVNGLYKNGDSMFSPPTVLEIRALWLAGMRPPEIAARYGVTVDAIKNICFRITYKEVE